MSDFSWRKAIFHGLMVDIGGVAGRVESVEKASNFCMETWMRIEKQILKHSK
jgi:hypothetical protein